MFQLPLSSCVRLCPVLAQSPTSPRIPCHSSGQVFMLSAAEAARLCLCVSAPAPNARRQHSSPSHCDSSRIARLYPTRRLAARSRPRSSSRRLVPPRAASCRLGSVSRSAVPAPALGHRSAQVVPVTERRPPAVPAPPRHASLIWGSPLTPPAPATQQRAPRDPQREGVVTAGCGHGTLVLGCAG